MNFDTIEDGDCIFPFQKAIFKVIACIKSFSKPVGYLSVVFIVFIDNIKPYSTLL